MAFVCFLYIQTINKLYKMYTNDTGNRIIYAPADVCFVLLYNTSTFFTFRIFVSVMMSIFRSIPKLWKISGPNVIYSKVFVDEFIL